MKKNDVFGKIVVKNAKEELCFKILIISIVTFILRL